MLLTFILNFHYWRLHLSAEWKEGKGCAVAGGWGSLLITYSTFVPLLEPRYLEIVKFCSLAFVKYNLISLSSSSQSPHHSLFFTKWMNRLIYVCMSLCIYLFNYYFLLQWAQIRTGRRKTPTKASGNSRGGEGPVVHKSLNSHALGFGSPEPRKALI